MGRATSVNEKTSLSGGSELVLRLAGLNDLREPSRRWERRKRCRLGAGREILRRRLGCDWGCGASGKSCRQRCPRGPETVCPRPTPPHAMAKRRYPSAGTAAKNWSRHPFRLPGSLALPVFVSQGDEDTKAWFFS